jgi:hypothetical protein
VAASASLINAMFAAPANYYVAVHTAAYPDGAIRGFLWYSYPTGTLSVATLVCPPGIQSATDLTPDAKESCLSVVLPADDVSGSFPPGYTISGYGGTAAFDYHVTDGKHLDATIANATRGGGGTCNSTSMTCSYGALPYEWTAGMGELHVIPTLLPAGTRFGAAEAKDALEPGGPVPLTVGAGNELTVDASAVEGVYVLLYLFQAPDTTAPSVSTPIVKLRSGATFGTTGPIRLVWTGSDAGSGIDHYVVQRSVDGGSWTTLSSVGGAAYNTSIARGHAYRATRRRPEADSTTPPPPVRPPA